MSAQQDPLARLRALAEAPLSSHPDVLEEVGDALAEALDEVGRLEEG